MSTDEVRLGPYNFGESQLVVWVPAGDPAADRLHRLLEAIGPPTRRACREVVLRVSRSAASSPSDHAHYQAELDGVAIANSVRLPDLELNLTRALNRLRLDEEPDLLHLHAGAVSNGDKTVLIIGPSHAGKSTIVAKLVALGWHYLTDEQIAVDATGRLYSYPRPLSLRRESWGFFPQVAGLRDAADLPASMQRVEVAPADLGSVYQGPPVQPDLIVVPDVSEPQPSISRLSCSEALAILIQDSLDLERADTVGVEALLALVKGAPAFRVAGRDLDVRCATVESLLVEAQPPGEVQASQLPTAAPSADTPGPGPAPDAIAWLFPDGSAAIYARISGVLAAIGDDGFAAWQQLCVMQGQQPFADWPAEVVQSDFVRELIQAGLFNDARTHDA